MSGVQNAGARPGVGADSLQLETKHGFNCSGLSIRNFAVRL